ncbi:MAG: hypothetical protein KAX30_06545 [Candidatus Atribacteria bacterium]|nr:hypothetical protein [Candidatus Atribacteria bacterium]
MKKEIRTLVLYRLNRADESLEEALILLKRGHTNTFVNRLYYADLVYFDKKEVGSWFDEAKKFISSIKNIIG